MTRRRRSVATGGEFVPVKAKVNDQQGCKCEGDDADCGQDVAEVAPVCGHKIEHPAGDEGKSDRIGTGHPLAMYDDLAVARGDEGCGGADHPRCCLHGSSGEARTAPGKSDTCERTDENGNHVYAAENAMEREMVLPNPRGEIDWSDQESDESGERMGDEEAAVGDHLETVGMVHGVIGDKENFRGNEDEKRREAEGDPENSLESGTRGFAGK